MGVRRKLGRKENFPLTPTYSSILHFFVPFSERNARGEARKEGRFSSRRRDYSIVSMAIKIKRENRERYARGNFREEQKKRERERKERNFFSRDTRVYDEA